MGDIVPWRRIQNGNEFHRERAHIFGGYVAKKKKNEKFSSWVVLPQKDMNSWLSEFLVSSMVVNALAHDGKKLPVKIRLPKKCMTENEDGSLTLHYEVEF